MQCTLASIALWRRALQQRPHSAFHTSFLGRVQIAPAACSLSGQETSTEDGFMQMQCSDGYTGPACSLCVRNSTHSFGRTGALKCNACQRPVRIVGAYIGSTFLVILYLCYNIRSTLKENIERVQGPAETVTVKASELLRVCPGLLVLLPFFSSCRYLLPSFPFSIGLVFPLLLTS